MKYHISNPRILSRATDRKTNAIGSTRSFFTSLIFFDDPRDKISTYKLVLCVFHTFVRNPNTNKLPNYQTMKLPICSLVYIVRNLREKDVQATRKHRDSL